MEVEFEITSSWVRIYRVGWESKGEAAERKSRKVKEVGRESRWHVSQTVMCTEVT